MTFTNPIGAPTADTSQQAAKGAAQAQKAYEKVTAATAQTTDLIKNSYSIAVKGTKAYNDKVVEFAKANTMAAFDIIQKLSDVQSPAEFMELSTAHARQQFETLATQTRELATLAQKAGLATSEPLKAGITTALGNAG